MSCPGNFDPVAVLLILAAQTTTVTDTDEIADRNK
jgi:hypothetical protein